MGYSRRPKVSKHSDGLIPPCVGGAVRGTTLVYADGAMEMLACVQQDRPQQMPATHRGVDPVSLQLFYLPATLTCQPSC